MFNAKSREEIEDFLRKDNHLRYVIEAGTGTGKTYMSLLKMKQWHDQFGGEFLIVIPKLALIGNWKAEFEKFGYQKLLDNVTFTTYISLHKHADKQWTAIIFDEVHHLSDRCKEIFKTMRYTAFIGLSATLKREVNTFLYCNMRGLEKIRLTLKDAIDNGVLPNPKVILIPMKLDNKMISEIYVKNPKAVKIMEISFKDRHVCRDKNIKYNIHCTQQQYYDEIENLIDWLDNHASKMIYLKKCGDRNKWLSDKKTDFVKEILKKLGKNRCITFCNSIEQANELGKYPIHSKTGFQQETLDAFNEKKINQVTAVEILTEGLNVSDCKVGVFAMLNGSSLLQLQKQGRILRHKKPVLIIPYYINTRDEEIVNKMIKNYDPNMIVTINDLNELKKHLK